MNSKALKDKIKFLSANNNIDPQALMQNFFLERILVRISHSIYKEKIILKGGLLIASIIGISNRSTMDLDATIKNYPMNIEKIEKLVREIIAIDIGDTIDFKFINIKNIREEDEYNGYRVKIDAIKWFDKKLNAEEE